MPEHAVSEIVVEGLPSDLCDAFGTLGADEVLGPVGLVEAIHAHRLASRRGMDELTVVDVDADVRNGLAAGAEEDQVARLHFVALDLQAGEELAGGVGRKIEADAVDEHVADEAAAIEAGGRGAATAVVTNVAELHGKGQKGLTGMTVDVTGQLGGSGGDETVVVVIGLVVGIG